VTTKVLFSIAENSKINFHSIINTAAMQLCTRAADVDWQYDSGILCYGDLWENRLFNIELHATTMFIRLFKGTDYLPSNEKRQRDSTRRQQRKVSQVFFEQCLLKLMFILIHVH
jgi:hypothetical protein